MTLFLMDHSGYIWSFPLKVKSEASSMLEKRTRGRGKRVGLSGQTHEEARYYLHRFYATQDVCMSTR